MKLHEARWSVRKDLETAFHCCGGGVELVDTSLSAIGVVSKAVFTTDDDVL